jgi:hypothetical protein
MSGDVESDEFGPAERVADEEHEVSAEVESGPVPGDADR